MYTKETLAEINNRYINCGHYPLTDSDIEKANMYVQMIENTRSKTIPKAGDRIIYTTDFGDYYRYAHIESIENGQAYICEQPYAPFVYKGEEKIWFSTSGGSWHYIDIGKLTYVGTEKKTFCAWGSYGVRADGAIEFEANVSLWEYKNENPMFVDENGNQYTTKNYDYMILHYSTERDPQYKYFGQSIAWRNEYDLQAWLKTFKAKVFEYDARFGTALVWYWKEKQHHVSPDEYDKICGFEDSMLCNGLRRCKRIYDEENHIVNTYFVWYWDAPEMGNEQEQWIKQNKIRERYELDWHIGANMHYKNKLKSEGKWYDLNWIKECYTNE